MTAEILVTVLCALFTLGLVLFALWILDRFFPQSPSLPVRIVISGRSDGSDLEETVRVLMNLRSRGLLRCPIYLLMDGLTPQGRELAWHIRCRWPSVTLLAADAQNSCLTPY